MAPKLEDGDLFRDAVRGAIPLPKPDRVNLAVPAAPAIPVRSIIDGDETLFDSLSDGPPGWDEALEAGEELNFLRDGLSRQVLKKLRRGHWVEQAYVDLHGMNREEARQVLGQFLAQVINRGYRCVRIIHGKGLGSKKREPVLKAKIKTWLSQRDEVLAYCQAAPHEGGAGATIVLLKA